MTSTHSAARRNAEEQARLDATLTDLFEQRITFNTVIGLKIESASVGAVRGRIEMRPELVGHYLYGRLHGGVISATLDAIGGLAVLVAIGERHADESSEQVMHRFARLGTVDLRIDYLRPGLGKHFIASCEVTRLGGRIASTQMRLVNDAGTLIATGCGSYMIS
jgi:uncharacterized protein (TIGR00369 family)